MSLIRGTMFVEKACYDVSRPRPFTVALEKHKTSQIGGTVSMERRVTDKRTESLALFVVRTSRHPTRRHPSLIQLTIILSTR